MIQRRVLIEEPVSLSLGKYLDDSSGLSKVLEAIDALADDPRPPGSVPWGPATSRLRAASGTFDIADAHVVICARRAGQPVVTSDPGDLGRLDPALRLITL